jgi:hypothetical protein
MNNSEKNGGRTGRVQKPEKFQEKPLRIFQGYMKDNNNSAEELFTGGKYCCCFPESGF